MAKKTFKTGVDSLFSGSESSSSKAKRGRPKVSTKIITKSSEVGTKEGEIRATFIVNESLLEDLKALAYLDRESIKTTLNGALEGYLKNRQKDVTQARKIYKSS